MISISMLTTSHRLKLGCCRCSIIPSSRWRGRGRRGRGIWIIWLFEVNTIYAERKWVRSFFSRRYPLMISAALTRSPTEIRITIRRQHSAVTTAAHFTMITGIAMIQVITLAHIVKFVSGIIIIVIIKIICQGIWVWWIWWCCSWCIHVHYVIVDIRRWRMWLSVIFNAPYCTRVSIIWCWASVRSTASLITIMLARVRRTMTNIWFLLLMH